MRTRIGYLTYALERSPGGIGQYAMSLLQALDSQISDILPLVAGKLPGQSRYAHLSGSCLLPGLLTVGQIEIARLIRKLGISLVHDTSGTAPLALADCKRVTTIFDVFPLSIPGHSTTLDTLICRYWLPIISKQVDAIITDSEWSKIEISKYLQIPEEKITVTSLSAKRHFRVMQADEIGPALARSGVEKPYILYVGSIEPRKNLLRLVEAYAQLRRWSQHWNLVIVGSRNLWKSSPVAKKVASMGLQSNVRFTGFVPDEDLSALYNGADLFCYLSLYEGFGLPVLEAMACGTPVITSNTSSLPEVAGEAALLVNPYQVEDIVVAMRAVLSNHDLAQDLRERGLRRAAQFSWDRTARETIAVYQCVLQNNL
jgi:glycosyltransferase involved in cell wall biosynthesis